MDLKKDQKGPKRLVFFPSKDQGPVPPKRQDRDRPTNKDSNAVENNDSSPQVFASCVAEDVVNHGWEVVAAVLLPGKVPEFLGGYSALS